MTNRDPVLYVTNVAEKHRKPYYVYKVDHDRGRRMRYFTDLVGTEYTFDFGPKSLPDSDPRKTQAHTWIIDELLKEGTNNDGIPEAKGVFRLRPKPGTCPIGLEAIYKVYVQLPPAEDYYDRYETTDLESGESAGEREAWALTKMMNEGCASTPKVYYDFGDVQGPDGFLPGGHIVGIVMELVPGVALCKPFNFWEQPPHIQAQIRDAFAVAIYEVHCHNIQPEDEALRNIIWDQEQKKCYLIDFESFYERERSEPLPYSAWIGEQWGLV